MTKAPLKGGLTNEGGFPKMLSYIIRRLTIIIPELFLISIVAFIVIQLPPGDFLTTYIMRLQASGVEINKTIIETLTHQYGLDRPLYVQYFIWIKNIILDGNFGTSFSWNRPVADLIKERLSITLFISLSSLVLTWIIAFPIGIYSATHQYSPFDHIFTFLSFVGVSMPGFLLALIAVWFLYKFTGHAVIGVFSLEYLNQPWSFAKFMDMIKNIWLPVIVVGMAGTAGLVRVIRAMMLDEIRKLYVTTARAKGLPEYKVLIKYPLRVAVSPTISTIGWLLPALVSGESVVGIVLNLQTIGPLLLSASLAQDMYLAGSIVLILGTLTVIGMFISDLLLAWLDPRVRYGER